MLLRNLLLPGVVLPALGAVLALALGSWWSRREPGDALGGGPLAVAAAFAAALVAASGWPRFPPVESTQRLFYWALVMAVLAFLWGRARSVPPPWPLPLAAVALLLWGMLRSPIEHRWTPLEAALWLVALAAIGWGIYRALEVGQAGLQGRAALEAAAVRLTIVGGAALVLGLSGTARLAQLMGAVACGVVVVEAAARWRGRPAWRPGDAVVLTVAVLGLLVGGYFFAEVGPWPALLLVGSLLLASLADRGRLWRLLPLLPLALAVGLVVTAFLSREEDPYGEYYGRLEPALMQLSGNTLPTAA